ncbi:Melanoma antigen_ [Chamberlinius hualienensis]
MSQRSTRNRGSQPATTSKRSSGSQRAPARRTVDSDSDDSGQSCSQASSKSLDKSGKATRSSIKSGLSANQIQSYTSDMVAYILANGSKNKTLRKENMVKHVIKDVPRAFAEIIEPSKIQLQKVFGLDLVEIPNHKNQYILINQYTINNPALNNNLSDYEHSVYGLLMLILSIIFMNGNHITESELWQALNKLGLEDAVPHGVFGNVQHLINKDLVKQLYLTYETVPNTQPQIFEYKWGPRATAELNKLDVLEFASSIYNIDSDQFPEQYKEATKQS